LFRQQRRVSLSGSQPFVNTALESADWSSFATIPRFVAWNRYPVFRLAPLRIPQAGSYALLTTGTVVQTSLGWLVGLVGDTATLQGVFDIFPDILETERVPQSVDEREPSLYALTSGMLLRLWI